MGALSRGCNLTLTFRSSCVNGFGLNCCSGAGHARSVEDSVSLCPILSVVAAFRSLSYGLSDCAAVRWRWSTCRCRRDPDGSGGMLKVACSRAARAVNPCLEPG